MLLPGWQATPSSTPSPAPLTPAALAYDEIVLTTVRDTHGTYFYQDAPPGSFDERYALLQKRAQETPHDLTAGTLFQFARFGTLHRSCGQFQGEPTCLVGDARTNKFYLLNAANKTYVRFGPQALSWLARNAKRTGYGLPAGDLFEKLVSRKLRVQRNAGKITTSGVEARGERVTMQYESEFALPIKGLRGVRDHGNVVTLIYRAAALQESCPQYAITFDEPAFTFCDGKPEPNPFVTYERVESENGNGGNTHISVLMRGNLRALTNADASFFSLPGGYRNLCRGLKKPNSMETLYCF